MTGPRIVPGAGRRATVLAVTGGQEFALSPTAGGFTFATMADALAAFAFANGPDGFPYVHQADRVEFVRTGGRVLVVAYSMAGVGRDATPWRQYLVERRP